MGDFHEAQDVAQQVFVEAFQSLGTIRDPGRLGAWLRSVTICRCVDRLRGRRETESLEGQMHESRQPGPDEQVQRQEVRQMVLEAIARLGKAQRETTALFYINGYTLEQVSAMQEVPLGTVKRRLHDARQRLKAEMMYMVEDVLKSESPREDFARKVFAILCQYHPQGKHPYQHLGWRDTIETLRNIGGSGLDGFTRAMESRHSPTRVFAMHMLEHHNAPQHTEVIVQLLLKALSDPNRKVRRHAVEALLGSDQATERKRREFVPRIIPLLGDPSSRVRRNTAYDLADWWQDVPLGTATRALLAEKDPEARKRLKRLVHAIVHNGEQRWYSE
jgi:RNA polymerase sigma factor (sigma-70 family)